MKGLDKFINEINTEVEKVKDANKKKLIEMQAEQLINHLKDVCDEEYDNLLAQNHKSFVRMWTFVVDNAKEFEVDGLAFVSDSTVFGWMDEYVGLDDKAEVEKEEKEKEESAKKLKESNKKIDKKIKQVQAEIKERKETHQMSIFDLA